MNKRILVIDPHEEVSNQIKERLDASGYDVLIERTGIAGLESARQFRPDMIYVEAEMEGVNGFQVCRILKDSAKYRDIPIVVMCDEAGHNHRFWAQQAGADAFLARPYAPDELIKTTDALTASRVVV